MTFTQTSDWLTDSMDQPGYDATKTFYYQKPSVAGGTTATIDTPWHVTSGQSYIVLVDGDLKINSDITVASGGFLAFIVSGKLTVDPVVTKLEGLYDADGQFVTQSQYKQGVTNDNQLAVDGSVVAWGGVSLGRDLGPGNASTPAERFTYRPDLLLDMPQAMKIYALDWQEVPAGTF